MLASDKLNVADETTLYHAVVRWGAAVLAEDVQGPGGGGGGGALQLVDVVAAPLRHVRLGLIDPATLHRVLRPGGLVPPERLLDAWAYQAGGAQLVDAASPQFVVRSGTRDERITKLVFESAFDTNGALHHIGTDGGQEDWANPHDSRRVVAAMSSAGNGSASRHVVTRPGGYNGMNHTLNTTNSWTWASRGGCRWTTTAFAPTGTVAPISPATGSCKARQARQDRGPRCDATTTTRPLAMARAPWRRGLCLRTTTWRSAASASSSTAGAAVALTTSCALASRCTEPSRLW